MTLYREHNNKPEYFTLALYPTLFDDFMLLQQCSQRACMRKAKREYFSTKKEALLHSLTLLETKRLEGYTLKTASR